MKFKELTQEQIDLAKSIYTNKDLSWDERMAKLMSLFNKSERTTRKWAVKLGFKEKEEIEPEAIIIARKKLHDKTKKRFLITSAQNATPIHKEFFNNLKVYAEFIEAEILVIPYKYKNPTAFYSKKEESDNWWDKEVLPYLTLNRHNLNKSLTILAQVKVVPTSSMPLQGLESMTGDHSAIVAHPRVHMKMLPVLDCSKPKIMLTTGTCTKRNYIQAKISEIASFHHTFGAAIVELKDDKEFFVRQITATDDGNFIDLYYNVKDGIVLKAPPVEAMILGDIHYGNHNDKILPNTIRNILPKLEVKKIILHDILDALSINHHEANNFVTQYHNEVSGKNSLRKELDILLDWLGSINGYDIVVVFSNHDDFLNRFIINADVKKNVKNALEYMEYGRVLLENKAPNGLLAYVINQKFPNIKCLGRDESYKIKGWELAVHGMDGINGSKGSIQQYKRLNTKIITGHAHSPARYDGAIQVGTNTTLRMSYTHGQSNWYHGDAIIHQNGKTQHLLYNSNGEYTTLN